MADKWPPKPDPFGALEPPRRNPPTAVGVANSPPPAGQPLYCDLRITRGRRLATAFVGTVLAGAATSVATLGGLWWALLSTGLGALSGVLFYRATRRVQRVELASLLRPPRLRRRLICAQRRAVWVDASASRALERSSELCYATVSPLRSCPSSGIVRSHAAERCPLGGRRFRSSRRLRRT